MDDGRVLLIVYTPNAPSAIRSIRAINQDKSIDWQYNPPNSNDRTETTYEIKQLPSGDLLGMGRATNTILSEPINDSPFLYKMNTEGDIIWKRVFYELDPQTGNSRRGFVRDAVELDNGDIYGIGEMQYDVQNEVFIFKVDADGCLDAEDCGFVQEITDLEDAVIDPYDLNVYPNLISNVIHYSISENRRVESVSLFDMKVRVLIIEVDHIEEGQMDATGLNEGVYLMKFLMDNGEVVYREIVKQ